VLIINIHEHIFCSNTQFRSIISSGFRLDMVNVLLSLVKCFYNQIMNPSDIICRMVSF